MNSINRRSFYPGSFYPVHEKSPYTFCFLSYIWRHLYKRATCIKTGRIGTGHARRSSLDQPQAVPARRARAEERQDNEEATTVSRDEHVTDEVYLREQ